MKKFLIVFLLIVINISMLSYAKVGDVAGQYYWTDIVTYLNGFAIDSINIGGQTLISAEDMQFYGFNVWWRADERILDIDSAFHEINNVPHEVVGADAYNLKQGAVRGNFYETDIVTLLDGREIISYNVGGRTYIFAEQMADFGYIVQWKEAERKLYVMSPDRAGYVYNIPITYHNPQNTEGTGAFSVEYKDGKTLATGDADYFISNFSLDKDGLYRFDIRFYQNGGLFYSTELMNKLQPLAYTGFGVDVEYNPEEKYDLVNQTIKLSVNGHQSSKMKVERGAGNGHRDYTIVIMDLPKYKQSEINEIKISVGEPQGEAYDVVFPDLLY